MFVIVGLGNPGADYESTRHNLGFMLIDKLAADAGVNVGRRECSSLVGRVEIESRLVKLAKPQTFMHWFGVALPEEALELRNAGITEPILCVGGFWNGQEKLCLTNNITPVVYRLDMSDHSS